MTSVTYDGTYEGWLTAIFDIYNDKLEDVSFADNEASSALLFGTTHQVSTDEHKAQRVLKRLTKAPVRRRFDSIA